MNQLNANIPVIPHPSSATENDVIAEQDYLSLDEIDQCYEQVRCLGHGSFGSVFLGRSRRSGNERALKFIHFKDLAKLYRETTADDSYEENKLESFHRELKAVINLNTKNGNDDRDIGIVFFKDWFQGATYACVVMNHVDGGTLSDAIEDQNGRPFSERRIASYPYN